jgi:transposase
VVHRGAGSVTSDRTLDLARSDDRDRGKALLGVEQWAEIRRMKHVERLSQREIHRRTGVHRDTIRRALASPEPPGYGPRSRRPSKLDPFLGTIEELLADEPTLSGVRVREELERLGYRGSKTILDDLLRELRPRFLPPPRSFQRTRYRPGELAQFDLCEPRSEIPVGHGQTRRGYIVTCELPYSRAFAGALVFSKEFPDIAFGMARCLAQLGALPDKLVWDREGAIAPRGRHAVRQSVIQEYPRLGFKREFAGLLRAEAKQVPRGRAWYLHRFAMSDLSIRLAPFPG